MNTRTVFALLVGATAALCSTTEAVSKYAKMIPNGNGVAGVTAVGHKDPDSGGSTNDFGKAFSAAGNAWTTELCKADSDGDGQTNGEELGDPCCEWKAGATPAVPSGATDPGNAGSKLSDDALKSARALCAPATVKPADGADTPATTAPTNETPALTPGEGVPTEPTPAPAPAPGAGSGSDAAATTTSPAASSSAAGSSTDESLGSGWMTQEEYEAMIAKEEEEAAAKATASSSSASSTANTSSAAVAFTKSLSHVGFATAVAVAVSALAVAL